LAKTVNLKVEPMVLSRENKGQEKGKTFSSPFSFISKSIDF